MPSTAHHPQLISSGLGNAGEVVVEADCLPTYVWAPSKMQGKKKKEREEKKKKKAGLPRTSSTLPGRSLVWPSRA